MRHPIIAATLVCIAVLLSGWTTRAEVRVVTDRNGDYRETRILLQASRDDLSSGTGVWTPVGRTRGRASTLNPNGDARADLWPAIGDFGGAPDFAWAIWSRLDGRDYDLAWSRWTSGGWQSVDWLCPDGQRPGDDLDPDLSFDSAGRPYVAWWRDEEGHARIYLSIFLVSDWMQAYAVSEPGVDARHPGIEINPEGEIQVTYETPHGTVEQIVHFNEPVTITDDIDPLDYISSESTVYVEGTGP